MAKWVKWRLQFSIWLKFFNSNAKFDWLPNHYCPKQNRPIASVTQSTMRSKIRRFLNLEVFQYLGYYLTKFTEQNFKRLWDCATDFNLGRSESVEMNGHHCSITHVIALHVLFFFSLFCWQKIQAVMLWSFFNREKQINEKKTHILHLIGFTHVTCRFDIRSNQTRFSPSSTNIDTNVRFKNQFHKDFCVNQSEKKHTDTHKRVFWHAWIRCCVSVCVVGKLKASRLCYMMVMVSTYIFQSDVYQLVRDNNTFLYIEFFFLFGHITQANFQSCPWRKGHFNHMSEWMNNTNLKL